MRMKIKRIFAILMCVSSLMSHFTLNVFADSDTASRLTQLESRLPQIESLMNECKTKGIATDYEMVDYTVIKKFIPYAREDLSEDYTERAEYIVNKLENMFDTTYSSLNSYINGTSKPLSVNRYRTSYIENDRAGFIADVKNGESGEVSRDHVFLTGYMGYEELKDDIAILPDLGINIMGLELGPRSVIIKPGSGIYGGWRITYTNAAEGTVAAIDDLIGQNDTKGLHITNNGGTIKIAKSIVLKPNTAYEIGCASINKSGEGVSITANGTTLSIRNDSTRFATSKTTFTSSKNSLQNIAITSNKAGENILDNLFIREVNTSENLLINSGFETPLVEKNGLAIDAGATDIYQSYLKQAAEHNIAVDLLISPHYFPSFVLEEDSSYSHGGSGFGGGGVEWYKDRIKEVMKEYIDALIPMVKDYPALMSTCLSNEPMFNLMYSADSFALPMWRSWLQEKYVTISALNKAYSSLYISFNSVPKVTAMSQSQIFYDWKAFNEELFADWHAGMADQIRGLAPNLKVHAKMVDYLSRYDTTYESKFMIAGTDANLFSDFSDIHGNDSHAYLEPTHMYQLQGKLEWYDFLQTISEKPILNSEDHIIKDQSKIYTDNQAVHVAADMWQGALHGRTATTSWVYARTYTTSSLLMDSFLNRPDVMSAVGKTNLNLNRVAGQMTALQNIDAEVGVLFSTATRAYNRDYMNCLYRAYEALLYSGYRASVLDEKAMAAGKWTGLKLIVIPDVKYVAPEMLTALKAYTANGGKILVLGTNNLAYNDYKQANAASDINAVLQNAVNLPTTYSGNQLTAPTDTQILDQVRILAPNEIKIVDAGTGEELSKTEYRYTDYNGKKLINICRYEWEDKAAEIFVNGKKATRIYDVVNQKNVAELNLSGYTPVMLYIDESELSAPQNLSALWDNGAYLLSWFMPEDSNADFVSIYMTNSTGTKLIDKVSAQVSSYRFKGTVDSKTTFTIQAERMGFVSEAVTAELANNLIAGVKNEDGKLILQGYSKTGERIAYTVVPNGENPAEVFSLAAMGDAKIKANRGFQAEIALNSKTDSTDDFTLYVGNGTERQALYFTYIKNIEAFENLFAVYNCDGYELYWKCSEESDITGIKISDGIEEKEYMPNDQYAFFETANTKKTYTITIAYSNGYEESVEVLMPIPLAFSCKTLDGKVLLSGTSQPNELIQMMVLSGEDLIDMSQLNADDYGRFHYELMIDDLKIPQSEAFTMRLVTSLYGDKTHEFIYTGKFPLHIGKMAEQKISFTNYTSRAVENAKVVVAKYNQSRLINCYSLDLTVDAEERIEKILTAVENGTQTRVFVWDELSGMKPLSRVLTLD